MDKDCESTLRQNARSYFLMSKVMEEDIFGAEPAAAAQKGGSGPCALLSQSGSSICCGLTPGMLQENPARRSYPAARGAASSKTGTMMRIIPPLTLPLDHGEKFFLLSHGSESSPSFSSSPTCRGSSSSPCCMADSAEGQSSSSAIGIQLSRPSAAAAGVGGVAKRSMYGLSSADAPAVLSVSQQRFLHQMVKERDELVHAAAAAANARHDASKKRKRGSHALDGCGEKKVADESVARINLRDTCKVPWRWVSASFLVESTENDVEVGVCVSSQMKLQKIMKPFHPRRCIVPSSREERIWVELTEPMLRSYAAWRLGSLQTQGFGGFCAAAVSASSSSGTK